MFSSYFCMKCKSKDVTLNKHTAWFKCNNCGHEFTRKNWIEDGFKEIGNIK